MGEITATPFDLIFKGIRLELKVSKAELQGRSRRRNVSEARQMFCHLARKHTTETTVAIGKAINRDHSSVVYGAKTMSDLCFGSKRLSIAKGIIEKNLRASLKEIVHVSVCNECNQPIYN